MRLGNTTKYALEALAYLIRTHARDEWGQVGDIAEACHIPRKYLEQVLLELRRGGIVESKKGQGGGYRLSRRPDEITLNQVLAAVQGELVPLPAWMDQPSLTLSMEFGLRDVVQRARAAVQHVFEETSIEVLVCHADQWLGNEMG